MYAELHCRTNFSFLEGASHGHELVGRAAELGHAALAITDRATLAGVVRAHVAARAKGLKLLIGAAVEPVDGPRLLLWAIDRKGYGRLARMLTVGRRAAAKGDCRLTVADVASHSEGLLAGVLLDSSTANQLDQARDLFADRCYAVAEVHRGPLDRPRLDHFARLARGARLPLVAANDVNYHHPRRRPLHDVLTATRHGCTVAALGDRRFPNAERHLKSPAEMRDVFADYPDAVARTLEVADRCTFTLDELRYDYPEELCPPGRSPAEYLTDLTWTQARERYPAGIPDKVRKLIERELALIVELRYEAYFITVYDLVRFARSKNILCQGRGSAANSAVCYCLGVTSVDPEQIDLLFERFISRERGEAPDIDIDFEHERREEVIQYVYDKYGRDRAGMTAVVTTYRGRSAVRDVGKALGLSADRVDGLAKALDHYSGAGPRLAAQLNDAGLDPDSRLTKQLLWLVTELVGFPRHLSQHVGGLVMTNGPLCELVPIENATMAGRTVVQWDKDDLDALGILKVDCLALGMLTAIRKCFKLIAEHHDRELDLATVPKEDPAVYDMVCRADTVGVFQIESRAQMSMLPRLEPRCFYDLVIEVAIVRPGPIQGGMVHPFLRRRQGLEPVEYPSEAVRGVLEKTLGVPIFQEQAMKLAEVAAGFTPGEADQLRRAMGAWRKTGVMDGFRDKLLGGMAANGYPAAFAEALYKQICGFGEYGFPQSHAASFAQLVYVSAWQKWYYPAAFCAALLNSQPMGFYAPAQLVADARRHGVEVRPADVNYSAWDCTLEPAARGPVLRLGFRLVRGLSEAHAAAVVEARQDGPFVSFADLVARTGLRAGPLKRLSQADAFRSLDLDRQATLWRALPEHGPATAYDRIDRTDEPAPVPRLTPFEEVMADYRTNGLTLRRHPMSFFRPQLDARKVVPSDRLSTVASGRRVAVAGVVLIRQRPATASGITFVTLEDEAGVVNLIVRRDVWERYRRVARTAVGLIAHGELQRERLVTHVLVSRLEDLSEGLADLDGRSRDFH
ncbi:MAG TPA: error-prone DNA polymerase [Gemmataceae bacterium]|nr:error-prone DNA polymerase [Gemmataceae bacterium]